MTRSANKFNRVKEYFLANSSWIIPLAAVGFILMIGIVLLLTWLSSRGRFMFLDCVARNKAHVRDPWYRFRNHGASLFAFRLAVGVIAWAIALAILAAGVALGWAASESGFNAAAILGLVSLGLLLTIVVILVFVIGLFTTDFVVPIMYLHALSCTQAWHVLLDVLSWNQGRFILYVLFQFFLRMAIASLVFGAACVTCGCACCFLAIPYIGTVVLLPILVFERYYSAYYLSQYGPQYNVFSPPVAQQPV